MRRAPLADEKADTAEVQTNAPSEPWPTFSDLDTFRVLGTIPSEHRAARAFARISVNEAATPYADGCVTLAPGAVIVASLSDAAEAPPTEHFVMERREDRWRYFVVGVDGRVRSGAAERCARCHADAPSDELFGQPGRARKKCIATPHP